MPAGRFHEHPQYRAEAMTLRDRGSEKGGLTEADWQKIHETFGPVLAFAVACHQ